MYSRAAHIILTRKKKEKKWKPSDVEIVKNENQKNYWDEDTSLKEKKKKETPIKELSGKKKKRRLSHFEILKNENKKNYWDKDSKETQSKKII